MLDTVIRFSLRHRPLIVFGCLVVLLYGGYVSTTMPLDIFPDLDRPRVVILTETPGMAPEMVETRITRPIESAMLGSQGVQAVRSQSSPSFSVVYVEFDWSTRIRDARQTVQERLSTLSSAFPEGVRPQLAPVSSILGQILNVGFYSQRGPNGGDLAPVGKTGL